MGKFYESITPDHQSFIQRQQIYFVGTATSGGRINVSPKGLDTLRVLDANTVVWLNLTGSGNETAAHLRESDRMTLMFCAFDGDPLILRLYGHARAIHPRDTEWSQYIGLFPAIPGARQIIHLSIDSTQTSCGFGVPLYQYTGQRTLLPEWATKKGPEGIQQYWEDRNAVSIDGKPTDY